MRWVLRQRAPRWCPLCWDRCDSYVSGWFTVLVVVAGCSIGFAAVALVLWDTVREVLR